MADEHISVRWGLAQGLSNAGMLPDRVLRKMVHDDVMVARPLLHQYASIDDQLLLDVIAEETPDHAAAIAHRQCLSDVVVCALISTGSPDVIAVMLDNPGLRLLEDQLLLIARIHYDHHDILARLLEQERLPFTVMLQLTKQLAENLGNNAISSCQLSDDLALRIVAATPHRKRYGIRSAEQVRAQDAAGTTVEVLYHSGGLDPDKTLEFALMGDLASFIEALSFRSGCTTDRVRSLLFNIDPRCAAAICLEAGLSTPHYLAYRGLLELAMACMSERRIDPVAFHQTLEIIRNRYDRLRHKRPLLRSLCGRQEPPGLRIAMC